MGLSYDLISEFVKITNDKKEGPKEGTVYATVVNSTGGKYVKIDGSDLLTPIDTTTGIEDGERVTVMIKDHKATVTGNITSPSVGKGTVNSLVGAVVDENLVGINADIENLIAKNAYLENVFAQNSIVIDSKIENLVAKDTYLENTYAENATIIDSKIENLEATDSRIENSVIENFQVIDGVVQDLKATNADIKVLNADFAQIKTLVNGNLTSDNILSFNLTSEKVTVDDAFIKDAMIDTISAGKINAGKINTNSVSIGSEDGGMLITGSTQQFMDKNGNVRIQIGKDASGDFTFVLYGENGQGQIINQNGITASAISDGLIVNNMVSDNAAISGGKLDISSVITEINSDDSTTIKSSKIYLNEQAQSLEVAFNSLKTKVDTIQEITIEGDLTAIVEQVQSNTSKIEANRDSINTLISQDTVIKKQVTDLQGTVAKTEETLSAKYTSLSQNLDGFKTTVADTYATKASVTDVVDNIEANYSTTSVMNSAIEQKAQEISASVSSTYATKNQVNTLDNTLRQDYSTTQEMESAINVAKEEINLGVSNIYETKENSTSKIQNAVNNIQVGGTNLWVLLDLKTGYEQNGNITTSGIQHKTRNTIIPTNDAKHLIYQCWNPNKVSNSSNTNRVAFFDSNKAYMSSIQVLALNGQTYQWQIINIPENTAYVRLGAICGSADKYDTTIKIKFELGNKPTDYSLAPEDVTNDISTAKTEAITSANDTLTTTISNYYTKSQTDSQINVAKEAINLGVSTTYETKENVQTKVTSTLNSAKSYADTKKTEAISTAATDATSKANTAKQEAIASANNTLTSTIANYYTKAQTDSQINVAKEEINLGVSTTYETKANAAENISNAVNNIKVGGRNLLIGSDNGYLDNLSVFQPPSDLTGTTLNGWRRFNLVTQLNGHEIVHDRFYTPADLSVYTFSIECRTDATTLSIPYVSLFTNRSGHYANPTKTIKMDNGHYKIISTFDLSKVPTNYVFGDSIRIVDLTNVTTVGATYIEFRYPKLEKGNVATDWSQSSEDIDSNITEAKNAAISSANNTLTSTIANYYTKSQTDSQINVAKEAINLSVSNMYETKTNTTSKISEAINNIKIGGTNLWVLSDIVTGWENSDGTITGTGVQHKTRQTIIPTNGAKQLIYQCWNPNGVSNGGNSNRVAFFDSSRNHISSYQVVKLNGEAHQQQIIDIPENTAYVRLGAICGPTDFYDETIKIKFELGNKPTNYSLAPEDVKNDISTAKSEAITSANNTLNTTIANYYTKSQTDSQINVAKEEINLGVSTTYETKENVTTKFNNINVGSVNRLTGTNKPFTMNMNKPTDYSFWDAYFTPNKQTLSELGFKVGDQVTVGFKWEISKNGTNDFVYGDFRTEFMGSDGNYKGVIKNPVAAFSSSNTKGRSEATVTLNETSLSAVGLRIRIDNSVLTLTISDVKMEKGNKATSWSPAPEDTESDITTIKSETTSIKETVSSLVLGTDSINASVKSLEESMINTTNGLASDISKVQEQVNLAMTSDAVKIEIQKELKKGANKVSTSTGFTFDDNGLNVSKSDSEMKTQITEDGMKIYKNSEVMLTANNQGVDAKNLHATTYLIIGENSRMEDYTEGTSKRTAVFWIG